MEITTQHIIYEPVWNALIEKYEDISPFEKHKSGNLRICHCRNQDDTFKTTTEFNAHIKKEHHKSWTRNFGKNVNIEMIKLRDENKELKKENAILNVSLEKQIARVKRLKNKFESIKDEIEFQDCD